MRSPKCVHCRFRNKITVHTNLRIIQKLNKVRKKINEILKWLLFLKIEPFTLMDTQTHCKYEITPILIIQ